MIISSRAAQHLVERMAVDETLCDPGSRSGNPADSREHWQIEKRVALGFGRSLQKGVQPDSNINAAENFALLRRLAASTITQDEQVDVGTQTKRMRATWDDEYREHLLQEF